MRATARLAVDGGRALVTPGGLVRADREVVVLELPRGRRGKIVLSRVKEQDGERHTQLVMMYPTTAAADAPLKRGGTLSIRDHELAQVIAVLISIDKKQLADKAGAESFSAVVPTATPAPRVQHRTIRAGDPLDDEELF